MSVNVSHRTGFVWHESYMWHQADSQMGCVPHGYRPAKRLFNQPWKHYENAEAKRRCHSLLAVTGLLDELTPIKPQAATDDQILRCHSRTYLARLRELSERDEGGCAGECTICGPGSYDIAKLAAGGCISALERLMLPVEDPQHIDNVYVLCRPPGHHAGCEEAKGFCLLNNVAIAVKHAMCHFGLQRVAIVDFDVHHGNGTESIFYDDPRVLFISIHQDSLYPLTTGKPTSTGSGHGEGFNLNLPVPPGAGIGMYQALFNTVVLPGLHAFQPQLIAVSSGVDACALDPLSHTMLPASMYRWMTEQLMSVESTHKLLMVHEGGYSEVYAPFCVHRIIEALAGATVPVSAGNLEASSPSDGPSPPVETLLVDEYEDEIQAYAGQSLQPHQDAIVRSYVDTLLPLLRERITKVFSSPLLTK